VRAPLRRRRSRTFAFTDLLPSTLVPQLDNCLGRFTISPVLAQDKDWCIYFEDEVATQLDLT
jgi:hypothetical protein